MTRRLSLHPLITFLATLVAVACADRTLPQQDGTITDGKTVADRPADRRAGDGPRREGGVPLDTTRDLQASWCKGPPQTYVDNAAHVVSVVKTMHTIVASCCEAGEVITFVTTDPYGKNVQVSLEVARFPNTPMQSLVDLAKPPAGWYWRVLCSPIHRCGFLRSDNATFAGTLRYQPTSAFPGLYASLCLEAVPKPEKKPDNPYSKPVRLFVEQALINLACIWGMDQTCNDNPMISSIKGKCNDDSTCTCNPGSTKNVSSGKCL